MVFSDIVDAADNLSPEEQLALVEILQRRLVEQNRQDLLKDIEDSRAAFAAGEGKPASSKEIMDQI